MKHHSSRRPPDGAAGRCGPMAASEAAGAPAAAPVGPLVDLRQLVETLPGAHLVVTADPDHVIVVVSDEYLRATVTERGAVLGQKLFDVFPDNPADPGADGVGKLRASLARAVATGVADRMPLQRYDIRRPGGAFEERWWRPLNTPVPGPGGGIAHVLHTAEDVTASMAERRRAADALRAERDRSRGILESMGDGFILLDREFRVAEINAEGLRIDGRPREEIVGRHLLDAWPEAEHFPVWPAYQRAMAGRMPVTLEYRSVSDRRDVWLDVHAYPVAEGGGGLAVFYRNITDRKRAEERLRESEARHRLTLEIETVAVVYFDMVGGITGANDTFLRLIGYTRTELEAGEVRYENLTPPDWTWRDEQTIRELLTIGHGGPSEKKYFRRDGSRMWILCASKMLDERTAVEFIIDVTERKGGEVALHESEARLHKLNETLEARVAERTAERDRMWESSPDLMLVISFEGAFLRVNPAWTTVLGYAPEDVVGHHVNEFVLPEDHRATIEAYELAAAGGKPTLVNCYLHRDGSTRWISWTAAPAGGVTYATGRDITAEKHRQAELETAQEALRQSQKMEAVGQLTGGLAHDFNNLLAGISGSLELLQARVAQGRIGDLDRYLAAAQGAAKRAAALTHRLLAFTRRQTLDPKPTNVNRLVAGMEELVRRTVGPQVAVEIVGAGGLWATLVDPNQLENALLNLCINARDAMPDGGRLTIETGNKWLDERTARQRDLPPGQYVSLCVSDTGTGMTPEVVRRAFDPFFTTKPIGMGTGLGLSMIYGFVQQSGGQARIYSEVGQGATVCLYLPRHHGEAASEEADAKLAAAPRAGAGETVLVVDDEPTVRMLVTEVLEDLGYTAIEVADGPAGLRVLRSDARIDLLVTDVGLPGGMNGRQVADAGRAVRPELRVLFITGYAENAVLSHGHLDPGMHVLTKPFAMEALASRIKDLIAGGQEKRAE